MNQTSATLMVAVCDQLVCIKINGRANFTSSLDLKKLVTELWEHGYSRFLFDLGDCVTMDSTFLGVLSGIGLKFSDGQENPCHGLELINPNPRISEVLENLGVVHLFKIVKSAGPVAEKFEPLAEMENVSKTEVTRTCLEAHKLLMSLNPENVRKFKDVTQFLAEDLKRLELNGTSSGC